MEKTKRYQQLMMKFPTSRLKGFLGDKIAEALIEWSPNGGHDFTKKELIRMIECIYGTDIFKDSEFRKQLLLRSSDDIFKIRDKFLSGEEKCETDPEKIAEIISSKHWRKDKLSQYLIDIWELPGDIFDKKNADNKSVEVISNGDDRFYELLDYQYVIKQRALNILNDGYSQERLFIHMPTGTGKTKTAMHIITDFFQNTLENKGLVLWIAHTNELLEQAYDTFVNVWRHLGNSECCVYRLWDKNEIRDIDKPLNGIVFCGLAKLMHVYKNNEGLKDRLKRDCRLIVFDEAHKALADETRTVIEDLMLRPEGYEDRALIGLSATPGRTTEDTSHNQHLSDMFGNKLIFIDTELLNHINMGKLKALNTVAEENIIQYFQERKILSKIRPERLTYEKDFSSSDLKALSKAINDTGLADDDYSDNQLKIFAENKSRNKKIMEKLHDLHEENIPTIVFACSVSHARMLSAMLTLSGIDNSLVVSGMSTAERREAINIFKDRDSPTNIIINYGVLTTGFDSKNIRCVFITRPTKSVVLYSQMLGRGLRGPMMGGNEECLLVDIKENLDKFDNESAFAHFDSYWR